MITTKITSTDFFFPPTFHSGGFSNRGAKLISDEGWTWCFSFSSFSSFSSLENFFRRPCDYCAKSVKQVTNSKSWGSNLHSIGRGSEKILVGKQNAWIIILMTMTAFYFFRNWRFHGEIGAMLTTRAASPSIKSFFGSKSPLVKLITFSRLSSMSVCERVCGCGVSFFFVQRFYEISSIFITSSMFLSGLETRESC